MEQPRGVHVRSDRHYRFEVDNETLWTAIEATHDYRRWWPWLRRLDAKGLIEGDRWDCVVQPPLPYALRFTVSLDQVVPGRLAVASIEGEIAGDARGSRSSRCLTATGATPGSCRTSSPMNGMLRTIAKLARPMAQFGHDWVLDTGARQFRARRVVICVPRPRRPLRPLLRQRSVARNGALGRPRSATAARRTRRRRPQTRRR